VILEFFNRSDGETYVRLLYYDGITKEETLIYLHDQLYNQMSLKDFSKLVNKRIDKAGGVGLNLV